METQSTRLSNLLPFCIDKKAHLTGKLVHAFILRNGLISDTFLSNRLVELYAKCSNMAYAHQTFDKIPQKNVYSWNAILCAHCQAGDSRHALDLVLRMPERNVVSWNNVIFSLVRNGFEQEAMNVYDRMIFEGFEPTRFTLASILSAYEALADTESGRRCHGLVFKIGLEKNVYVTNALLSMYAKCGVIGDAIQVFNDMNEPSEVTFTALMNGLAQTDHVREALLLFRVMLRKGISVDSIALSSIMSVCAREGFRELDVFDQNDGVVSNVSVKQVHCLLVKLGFKGDLHMNNSLLDMYAKNGDMDAGEKVFANLAQVNVISWNVMIGGYGQICQT